jgi:adenylate cyclase
VDTLTVHRLWLASGFADPEPGRPVASDADVEVLQAFDVTRGVLGEDVTVQLVRVIGSSLARIADAIVSTFIVNLVAPTIAENPSLLALAQTNAAMAAMMPSASRSVDVMLRNHIWTATRPLVGTVGAGYESKPLAVGFADLVGFTGLSSELEGPELAAALAEFEARASDLVVGCGGRVVKLVGDEVMFAAPEIPMGADIALSLAEAFADDPVLPQVRVGLSAGDVISRDGDLYGPVVNKAHRIVKLGRPGRVTVSSEVRRPLLAEYRFTPLGRRRIKGFTERQSLYGMRRL